MTAVSDQAAENRLWLRAATAPWKRLMLMSGALAVADVAPAVAFAAGLALAVGALSQGVGHAAPGVVLAVLALVSRGLLAQATTAIGARAATAVKNGVRDRMLKAAFSRSAATDAQVVTAVVEGVEALDGHVARFAPARAAAVVSPLLLIGAAAVVSPFTAGILVFTLFPFVVGMGLVGMAASAESRRQFEALERLAGLFLDRVRALPAILSFQAEARETAVIAGASDALASRTGRVLKIAFLSSAVLEFFSALAVALVAVYCGFNLLKLLPFPAPEQLDLTRAFFLLALAPEVYAPMRRLAAAYHDRQAAESATPALRAMELEPNPQAPILAPAAPTPGGKPPMLRFERVSIAYEPGRPAVEHFDLAIPSGGAVALVGPSGSGKSSLLHLLLGLAPLSEGEVLVGDRRLSEVLAFTPLIGWAGQAPVVVPGTLEENIALAWREASQARIREAAARAGLNGDLSRRLDERGGGLSGGERRRLGLARALLKPAPLLLLDEPTANLDAASEAALLPVIRDAARGRTTLIATHSEAVAALADSVVRL